MHSIGDKAGVGDQAAPVVRANFSLKDLLNPAGRFRMVCRRKDGSIRWIEEFDNLITDEGKQYIMETCINGDDTAITTWYMGLVDDGGSDPVAGDTSASTGFDENTAYSGSNRANWTHGSYSSGSIDNSGQTSPHFDFTGAGSDQTLKGAFISSKQTQGDGAGTLLAAGLFNGSVTKTVSDGETLDVTYTLSIS